jgi:VanZ family protein
MEVTSTHLPLEASTLSLEALSKIRDAGLHPGTAIMVPLGYGVFLITATHWPSLSMNELHSSDFADKFYHFFGYMGFAIVSLFALRMSEKYLNMRIRTVRLAARLLVVLPALCCIALADELTQPIVGRNFSVFDVLFDFLGVAVPITASCLGLCFMALFERRHFGDEL